MGGSESQLQDQERKCKAQLSEVRKDMGQQTKELQKSLDACQTQTSAFLGVLSLYKDGLKKHDISLEKAARVLQGSGKSAEDLVAIRKSENKTSIPNVYAAIFQIPVQVTIKPAYYKSRTPVTSHTVMRESKIAFADNGDGTLRMLSAENGVITERKSPVVFKGVYSMLEDAPRFLQSVIGQGYTTEVSFHGEAMERSEEVHFAKGMDQYHTWFARRFLTFAAMTLAPAYISNSLDKCMGSV